MTSRSRNCSTLEGGNQKDRFATIFRVVAFPEHGVGSPVVRCHIGVFCITSPALCIISIADDILTLSLWSQGASAQLLQIPQMVWRHRNGEIASRKSVTSYFDILWLTTVFSRLLFRRSFSLVVSSEPPTGQDLKKNEDARHRSINVLLHTPLSKRGTYHLFFILHLAWHFFSHRLANVFCASAKKNICLFGEVSSFPYHSIGFLKRPRVSWSVEVYVCVNECVFVWEPWFMATGEQRNRFLLVERRLRSVVCIFVC